MMIAKKTGIKLFYAFCLSKKSKISQISIFASAYCLFQKVKPC